MGLLNMFKKNKFDFIPGVIGKDPYDQKDYQLISIQPKLVSLPDGFNLINKMTSVQKQNYGSCTAHMADGLKEFFDSQEYHKEIKLSQRFIYHNTKKISGLWNIEGDYLRNALLSVCRYGAPLEEVYPDDPKNNWEEYVKEEPSAEIYKEAEKYKGDTFWSVGKTLDNFRQAIFQQKAPIGFGMMWYESYRNIGKDGILPLASGKELGGHAIDVVDWINDKLRCRNSWGINWGENGYFYIPFSEFAKHDIWDAWILTDIVKQEEITGWAAENYLTEISPRFHIGDIITPTHKLNLREKPTTNSAKITLLGPGQQLEVLEGGIEANGYKWWNIKVKN